MVDPTTSDMYISDTGNSVIRKIEWSSGLISTVAGIGQSAGFTGMCHGAIFAGILLII